MSHVDDIVELFLCPLCDGDGWYEGRWCPECRCEICGRFCTGPECDRCWVEEDQRARRREDAA